MFGKKKKDSDQDISEKPSEAMKILTTNIENYEGYKENEYRRDSDIAFRTKLLAILRDTGDMMSQVHELLIHSQLLTSWGPAGLVMKKIGDLRKEASNTDYKYSTFFDVEDVEGEHGIDLSILYILEIEILDQLEEFKDKIFEVKNNLEEMMLDAVEDSIANLMTSSSNLYNRFNERNELIRAFEKMSL
ncbi:MAG: hypothetical protein KAS63_08780 [Candidatus Heimdallarchaeota archaeon]|nr:hypothetical protein [Candidatus Heimdallarchaeota archaeon]MCK4955442.1 hypothetical protein [Candidatus Heimdallarchaeota archaeon]